MQSKFFMAFEGAEICVDIKCDDTIDENGLYETERIGIVAKSAAEFLTDNFVQKEKPSK